jgi:hypothetical protein
MMITAYQQYIMYVKQMVDGYMVGSLDWDRKWGYTVRKCLIRNVPKETVLAFLELIKMYTNCTYTWIARSIFWVLLWNIIPNMYKYSINCNGWRKLMDVFIIYLCNFSDMKEICSAYICFCNWKTLFQFAVKE